MRDWPQRHRNLAALAILAVLGTAAVYFFLLRPKARDVALARESLTDLRAELEATGQPLDSERLGLLLEESRRSLEGPPKGQKNGDIRSIVGIKPRSEAMLEMATSMFDPKIDAFFQSAADFVREVSRLDYQEEYTQLERRLKKHDIILAEEVLGIGENTASDEIYKLLLQVWTVDALAKLLVENGLSVAKAPSIFVVTETGRRQVSKISVLPVQAYYLNLDDKQPYVLEFAVEVTVRGELQALCNLLRAAHTQDRYFPVTKMELMSEVPSAGGDGELRVARVTAKLEFSAFFRIGEKAPPQRRKQENYLPAGA